MTKFKLGRSVRLYKAKRVGDQATPNLKIVAKEEIPEMSDYKIAQDVFNEQARVLLQELSRSLPGGTLHALLVAMLEQKTSLLRIVYEP